MCSMLKVLAIVAIVVLLEGSISHCHATRSGGDDDDDEEEEDYKLPSDTRPEAYQLHLHTDIHGENFNFSAHVKIKIRVVEATESIVLHSLDLNIKKITLCDEDGEVISASVQHEEDKEKEIITVNLESELEEGTLYELVIEYDGTLPSDFIGSFHNERGETESYFLALSFHSSKFRRICPSYDEYDIRAVYEIEIEHHKSYDVLANSKIISEIAQEDVGDFVTTKFVPTASLPTTSLAIIVSNLDSMSFASKNEPNVAIHGREVHSCAVESARDVIALSQNHFSSSHKLSNLKLVALSTTVSPISTHELIILNQRHITSRTAAMATTQKAKFLRVLARSVAQQYFGNVVTMRDWRETYLTEGLGIYFADVFADEYGVNFESFNFENLRSTLEIDSLLTAKSLEDTREKSIDEITEFSGQKTANILKMFQSIYGEEKFIQLSQNFIKNFAFKEATVEDFLSEIEESEMKAFIATWFSNIGYPLITISDKNSTHITLSQERFLLYDIDCTSCDLFVWIIPIIFIDSNGNESEVIWMSDNELDIKTEDDWIVLKTGYYRVNYNEHFWSKVTNILIDESTFERIPALSRATLLNDAANLAFAEKLSYDTLFNLLAYLKHENKELVWKTANDIFNFLDMMISTDLNLYESFMKFIKRLIEPIYDKYEVVENESARGIRKIAIYWACKVGIQSCLDFISQSFEILQANPDIIDKEDIPMILCNTFRSADETKFNTFLNQLAQSSDNEELIYALACTEDYESLIELIKFFNTSYSLTNYDRRHVLIATMNNYKFGARAGIELFRSFLLKITDAETEFMLSRMMKRMWNAEWLRDFSSTISSLMSDVKISVDAGPLYNSTAMKTSQWLSENREEILIWFDENLADETTASTSVTAESTTTAHTTTTDGSGNAKVNIALIAFIIALSQVAP